MYDYSFFIFIIMKTTDIGGNKPETIVENHQVIIVLRYPQHCGFTKNRSNSIRYFSDRLFGCHACCDYDNSYWSSKNRLGRFFFFTAESVRFPIRPRNFFIISRWK